jgi:hypothetical protein
MADNLTPARRRLSGQRGQAMTETLLMTLPLVMLLAAVYQIFLADEHVFRLATRSYARLFIEEAFPSNSASRSYTWRFVDWDGPERDVPVVGFFRLYGLSAGDMRIRSARAPGLPKRVAIGAGTAPSVSAAGSGAVYYSLGQADNAISDLGFAWMRSSSYHSEE